MSINWDLVDYELLGELIRSRTSEKGLTINELSEQLNLSRSMTSMALSGRRRLTSRRYREILDVLDIEETELPIKFIEKPATKPKGEKVFVSYSHKDHVYLDRLMVHLKPLEKQGLIDPWVDTRLMAGDKWKKEIEKALKSAKVGILLISADFLASDFIIDNELPPMLQNAEDAGTLIIPVILKPCRFIREKNLREFQAINSPDEPLSLLNENERELIYDTIAQRIEDTFEN